MVVRLNILHWYNKTRNLRKTPLFTNEFLKLYAYHISSLTTGNEMLEEKHKYDPRSKR